MAGGETTARGCLLGFLRKLKKRSAVTSYARDTETALSSHEGFPKRASLAALEGDLRQERQIIKYLQNMDE